MTFRIGSRGPAWAIACLALLVAPAAHSFSFDDLERIERVEQTELLDQARRAAQAWRFGEAESFLGQARARTYDPQAVAAVEQELTRQRQAHQAEQDRLRREEEERRLAEQRRIEAAQAAAAAAAAGGGGGSVNCTLTSSNYALFRYCTTGSCDGFSINNYGIWNLCQNNDPAGLSTNYSIFRYLTTGDTSGFYGNIQAWNSAQRNAGSFESRKRFVIYHAYGFILQ